MVPAPATRQELIEFHDEDYVDKLLSFGVEDSEDESNASDSDEEYNLVDDSPVFDGISEHVRLVTGASLAAAELLISGECDVAINWTGGRHHASFASASGFCYINDIVLAAQRLEAAFGNVLVLDIDIHHGDGTESAFRFSNTIMTASFHQYAAGFFPGTGESSFVIPSGPVNVGFKPGVADEDFVAAFNDTLGKIASVFKFSAAILVLGADGLVRDPLGEARLTSSGLLSCLRATLRLGVKTLVLGGGGYDFVETARTWAAATALIIRDEGTSPQDVDIPEHDHFELYGPSFSLATQRP